MKIIQGQNSSNEPTNPLTKENICHSDRTVHCLLKNDRRNTLQYGDTVVKNPPANAGNSSDASSIPGSGRPPGGGNDNLLQYSFLGNPMSRGAWRASPCYGIESGTTEHTCPNKYTNKDTEIKVHTLLLEMFVAALDFSVPICPLT